MKTLKWIGILSIVAITAFLIGTAVSSAFAQGGGPWGNWGRGMMGGYAPNTTQPYSGTFGYGMMGRGGMMGPGMTLAPVPGGDSAGVGGFWNNPPSAQMPVSMAQARDDAVQYLKTYLPNAAVEDQGDTFYGYYNFDVLQNDKTYGMLSVNGYTGQVWYHTWHGAYIASSGG